MHTLQIEPIAYIKNDFKEKFGIPRQSGRANSIISKIIFEPKYKNADAFRGLEEFTHIWLIFNFSECEDLGFSPLVRPPRLGGNKKVGVFASRSPFRPNRLGLSCVKLEKVVLDEKESPFLFVSGADLLDGTPIFDIKPYVPHADCKPFADGSYADFNCNYKLLVEFTNGTKELIPNEKLQGLIECLEDDPRPSYQEDEKRIYGMLFANLNVKFKVKDDVVYVVEIEQIND